MIKSPCKDCEVYKESFPSCSESCALLKKVQELCDRNQPIIKIKTMYVPSENHSFVHRSTKHKAMS